jgi:23S rRNA pseudouridine1911/1915/1917 synthase
VNEEIPEALAGERVDRIVAMLTGLSRAFASDLVAAGAVRVDGDVELSGKTRLAVGQVIDVEVPPDAGAPLPKADPSIEVRVVHQDDHVIVIDKPAGLVVHPGHGNNDGTLVNALLARFPEIATVGDITRPGIVHRLDKGTSGLLVVARNQNAYESLVEQLQVHSVTRRYVAIVWGVPEPGTGMVDAPLGRSPRDPLRMAVVQAGKPARTRYEVVDTFDEPVPAALVTCWLETGRTHQIRVHLAAIGHPVVGDTVYALHQPRQVADRPMLHAEHLEFTHPSTGELAGFTSPLPPEIVTVLAKFA